MPRVPGVIPSAAAGVPYHSAKRTRLEYSTVAKTGLIDPASKNDYNLYFPAQNNQKNQKTTKKFGKNNKKNNMNTTPKLDPKNYTEVSTKHLLDGSEPQSLKKICFGGSDKKIGCGWSQFSGDIGADIRYVSSFMVKQAIKFMKTPIFIDERKVELYQTNNVDELVKPHSLPKKINIMFSECKTELLTQKKSEKTTKIIKIEFLDDVKRSRNSQNENLEDYINALNQTQPYSSGLGPLKDIKTPLNNNSIPKALKKACYGGSNTKVGCSWTQFSGNINSDIHDMSINSGKCVVILVNCALSGTFQL
ncbi:hypothetical protein BB561_005258 [Smittium simulii]|uniref:Uncharacterized protein n=1 Tax=Smittium simulii TaxID=133385 RepID=A0A2T9YB76_9FUNG|nr:hypothetical protein BB561_005258 [Smittium simulii]